MRVINTERETVTKIAIIISDANVPIIAETVRTASTTLVRQLVCHYSLRAKRVPVLTSVQVRLISDLDLGAR